LNLVAVEYTDEAGVHGYAFLPRLASSIASKEVVDKTKFDTYVKGMTDLITGLRAGF
jgi:hypothetical protein